MKVSQLTNFRF